MKLFRFLLKFQQSTNLREQGNKWCFVGLSVLMVGAVGTEWSILPEIFVLILGVLGGIACFWGSLLRSMIRPRGTNAS